MRRDEMKKNIFGLFFILSIIVNSVFIPIEVSSLEEENRIYISKTGEMWDDYVNMMNIVFPGEKISGLYYHKLYAEYNASVGGFIVMEKVASHISYSKSVGLSSFGLCFSYNPEYEEGKDFGKENYKIWSKLRAGDVLFPHGIDFTAKTIKTKGKLSNGTLDTEAYFTVSFLERKKEPTAYSGKTIVALGDSVTCNGGWIEAVGDLLGCEIINSGVSADRATEALVRFEMDVSKYSPDIVLVMLGINDCVQYYYSEKTVLNFKNELYEIKKKCKSIGAETIYVTPNNIKIDSLNFDRYKDYGGISECFPKFIQAIKDVANETNSYCIDVYSAFSDSNELLCDSVHPNKEGYSIIISVISDFLISYADRICAEAVEGFVLTGEGDAVIEDGCVIINSCTVGDLRKYFCNDIKVYKLGEEITDNEFINDECVVYWIDKSFNKRGFLEVNII